MSMHSSWQIQQRDSFQIRILDDQVVVFDSRSGDTHLLDEMASLGFQRLLAEDSSCREDLIGWLAKELDIQADSTVHRYVDSLLDRLCELDLVEKVEV